MHALQVTADWDCTDEDLLHQDLKPRIEAERKEWEAECEKIAAECAARRSADNSQELADNSDSDGSFCEEDAPHESHSVCFRERFRPAYTPH